MFAFLNALTRTTSGKDIRVHVVCKIRGQVGAKRGRINIDCGGRQFYCTG